MSAPARPRVLLVHGLLNARGWLLPLAWRLRGHGFEPELFGYASVLGGPQRAIPALVERLRESRPDGIVGHSLGGLLALQAVRVAPDVHVHRVVCLGSPLRGSRTARSLAAWPWGRPLLGRSAGLLQDGLERWSGVCEVGVVAGDLARGVGRLFARFEDGCDGTVGLDETRLPGVSDHCVVHCSHTGLVLSREAAAQAARFLRHGRFEHGPGAAAV